MTQQSSGKRGVAQRGQTRAGFASSLAAAAHRGLIAAVLAVLAGASICEGEGDRRPLCRGIADD